MSAAQHAAPSPSQALSVPDGSPERDNPYVGPRPFDFKDRSFFFGREREVRSLRNLLIAERIVLFYAPSGAGKTSLLRAGLVPALRREQFRVLPIMRINQDLPARSSNQDGFGPNRYVFSALTCLEEDLPREQRVGGDLSGLTLADYLSRLPATGDDSLPAVLIFDQFEEILTLESTSHEARGARKAFFAQVGDVLSRPDAAGQQRWALFSVREDYVAALDPYLRPIPTRLAARFRLELLEIDAAKRAIEEPPRRPGFDAAFAPAATDQLVRDLAAARSPRDGQAGRQGGIFVEPVHLQIVCSELWDRLRPPPGTEITVEQVGAIGDVDTVLGDYYERRVEAIAAATPGVRERDIRAWFDQRLITGRGMRNQVPEEPGQSGGLDNRVIDALVRAQLVRREKRLDAPWFELAHDRLVDPILARNEAWYRTHLSVLDRAVEDWRREGFSSDRLLRGAALAQAEQEEAEAAEGVEALDPDARRFLDESRSARRTALWWRRIVIAGGVVLVVLAALTWIAIDQWQKAEDRYDQAQRAIGDRLAAQASNLAEEGDQVDLALLLALEAERVQSDDVTDPVRRAVFAALTAAPQLRMFLYHGDSGAGPAVAVTAVAFGPDPVNPDRALLASGAADGTVRLWDPATGSPLLLSDIATPGAAGPPAVPATVTGLVFSPDGAWLAAGAADGSVRLWDVRDLAKPPALLAAGAKAVTGLAFGGADPTLAVAGADGAIRLWILPVSDMQTPDHELRPPVARPGNDPSQVAHQVQVRVVAFSRDGGLLAAGRVNGAVTVWSDGGAGWASVAELNDERLGEIAGLAFEPTRSDDTAILAAGGSTGRIVIWAVRPGTLDLSSPLPEQNHGGEILALAYDVEPGGVVLHTAGRDGRLVRWAPTASDERVRRQKLAPQPIAGTVWRGLSSAAFAPDGLGLALGGRSGEIAILGAGAVAAGDVLDLTWTADGEDIMVADRSGSVVAAGGPGADRSETDGGAVTPTARATPTPVYRRAVEPSSSSAPLASPTPVTTTGVRAGGECRATGAGRVTHLVLARGGGTWVTGGSSGQVLIWDADLTTCPESLGPAATGDGVGEVAAVVLSAEGSVAAAGDVNGRVIVWDRRAGGPGFELPAPGTPGSAGESPACPPPAAAVAGLALSASGSRLAVAYADGSLAVWTAEGTDWTGDNVNRRVLCSAGSARVDVLAFDTDGQRLATGDASGGVRLLDADDPSTEVPLLADGEAGSADGEDGRAVSSLAFSGDGALLAAGREDGVIEVWERHQDGDRVSFQPLGELRGHDRRVTTLAFEPKADSARLASGDAGGLVVWWPDFEAGTWDDQACAVAGRELTIDEWTDYVDPQGDRPQEVRCPARS